MYSLAAGGLILVVIIILISELIEPMSKMMKKVIEKHRHNKSVKMYNANKGAVYE